MNDALMQLGESIDPLREFAAGEKAKMIAEGWTPEAAEEYALEVLLILIRQAMKAGK